MSNLLAYIPVLNKRHIEWFKRHPGSNLYLIRQEDAERILPRLSRHMGVLPTEMMVLMIHAVGLVSSVQIFQLGRDDSLQDWSPEWIIADEDVSVAFYERYVHEEGEPRIFENIWARYDMRAVFTAQQAISDCEISSSEFDREVIQRLSLEARRSPDWWRQIASMAMSQSGEILAVARNTHMPTEYECDIFGDPAINRDAGQAGKSCSMHAEIAVITLCAKYGMTLEGGSLYVTTFPCEVCARSIAFAGVKKLYFRDGYSSLNAQDIFRAYGVRIVQVR